MSRRRSTKEKESSSSTEEESAHLTSTQPQSNPLTSPSNLFKLFLAFIFGAVTYNFFTRDSLSPRKFRERSDVTSLPESYAICTDEGRVYTVDTRQPTAQCLLVRKDRLHKVGSRDDVLMAWNDYQLDMVKKFYGGELSAKKPLPFYYTRPGAIIVPGLADAHAHLMEWGFKNGLPLDGAQSLEDILDLLESYVRSHDILNDKNEWVVGMGWDQTRWGDWRGGFPSSADLSTRPSLNDRPIALYRVDGHALWASRRAVEIAQAHYEKTNSGKAWPPADEDVEKAGGKLVKDKNGGLTGVFVDTAMSLVPIPPFTLAQAEDFTLTAVRDAVAVGLTSVTDADVGRIAHDALLNLAEDGRLKIRVNAMLSTKDFSPSDITPSGDIERLENFGIEGKLDIKSVKGYSDGALGSWGAALLEPYSDDPSTSGIMRMSEGELEEVISGWWKLGNWGVNSTNIPAHEAQRRRPRIEHAQVMTLDDVKRIGELGVIASVQPTHATSDMWYAESRLGAERIKGAYAYQSLLRSSQSGVLPLGTDFPIEDISPLGTFYAAVTRADKQGASPHGAGGWYATEALTRDQALKGMTLDVAYASFKEEDIGSLETGKKADFVVLDTDIMIEPLEDSGEGRWRGKEILDTKVLATVIDGRLVYGAI
ncbi:hypothetical protein NLI96_g7137 [Meripilus lineatus]|uniref:Amidohydrolase 3 domain-containing protein n=1 Tax=Meripilus lineatus TaxID=2056292 RepID=A0AAD5V1H4_9APHY|nr:hypothetical protein NLI96_g7137 [Physisporinus lineatus]